MTQTTQTVNTEARTELLNERYDVFRMVDIETAESYADMSSCRHCLAQVQFARMFGLRCLMGIRNPTNEELLRGECFSTHVLSVEMPAPEMA